MDHYRPSIDYDRPSIDYDRPWIDYDRLSIDYNRPSIDYNRPSIDHFVSFSLQPRTRSLHFLHSLPRFNIKEGWLGKHEWCGSTEMWRWRHTSVRKTMPLRQTDNAAPSPSWYWKLAPMPGFDRSDLIKNPVEEEEKEKEKQEEEIHYRSASLL